MRPHLLAIALGAACLAGPALAAPAGSAEMARIFAADQADRAPPVGQKGESLSIDWAAVAPRDAARREEVRKLLAEGAIQTAEDYREAAFVFQHGSATDDYLLAHTLALAAVAKGDQSAMWIATATLDRYLMTTGKPQVFGTQFTRPKATGAWTQEPYDRALISDPLKAALGVPDLAAQARRLAEMQKATPAKP